MIGNTRCPFQSTDQPAYQKDQSAKGLQTSNNATGEENARRAAESRSWQPEQCSVYSLAQLLLPAVLSLKALAISADAAMS